MPKPEGRLGHAEIKLGLARIYLADEFPEYGSNSPLSMGGSPVTVHLYVENADETFEQMVNAGSTVTMPLMDAFWGDRYGKVTDPFGHNWSIAHPLEKLSSEQMMERMSSAMATAEA